MNNTSPFMNDQRSRVGGVSVIALATALYWLGTSTAFALPSYAEQTGLPCSQCHTIAFGPALTAYGRQFKLNAYALGESHKATPLALMGVVTYTRTAADQPEAPAEHFDPNGNTALNELTGFFAGHIGSHAGGFVEVAYSGVERHAAWGAFDLRYARSFDLGGHSVVAGVTLNNNPTVSDLWNSTPVWSFPFVGSDLAPTPGAAPAVVDAIGEKVLGPTVYAMFNDHWYMELGGYSSLSDGMLRHVGLSADDNSHVVGLAPYWRTALQFTHGAHYYSFGMLGLDVKQRADPTEPATDRHHDLGFDATYQYTSPDASNVAANLSLIHETRHLDASVAAGDAENATGHLNSRRFDVTYTHRQTWVVGVGGFGTAGSSDADLYAPEEVAGSDSGKPDSRGYLLQLEYLPFGKLDSRWRPWLNLRVGLQYTGYTRFNGGKSNYDGFGRNASDNNTTTVFLWAAL